MYIKNQRESNKNVFKIKEIERNNVYVRDGDDTKDGRTDKIRCRSNRKYTRRDKQILKQIIHHF